MKALYDNMKAWGQPLWQTLHQIGGGKTSVNAIQKVLAKRTVTPVLVDTVTVSQDGKNWIILLDGSYANKGDVLRLVGLQIEADVIHLDDDTGEVWIRKSFTGNVQVGNEIDILFYTTPEVDGLTNAVKVAVEGAALKFKVDSVETDVNQDTTDPLATVALPVEEKLKSVRSFHRHNYAATTVTDAAEEVLFTTAAIVKKILIADTAGAPLLLKVDGVTAFIVPRGGFEIEHYIPSGSDIGIQSVSGDISAGDLILNLVG